MIKTIYKGIALLLAVIFLTSANPVYAENTHSISLVKASSQYLSITDVSQTGLDITGDITLEAWIKLSQLPSTAGSNFNIISKRDRAAVSDEAYDLFIPSGTNKMRIVFSDGTNYTISDCDTAFAGGDVGVWRHIAAVIDVSVPNITFYIDGTAKTDTPSATAATSITNSTADFRIGARSISGTPEDFFDGLIDEVRVSNSLRYSSSFTTQTSEYTTDGNTQGLWHLNNDLLDSTANNNDLTNNNSATFSTDVPFVDAGAPAITEEYIILFE